MFDPGNHLEKSGTSHSTIIPNFRRIENSMFYGALGSSICAIPLIFYGRKGPAMVESFHGPQRKAEFTVVKSNSCEKRIDIVNNIEVIQKLKKGNELYLESRCYGGDVSPELRRKTAEEGQHPYAIVIACSDSRVIPEAIFSAVIGGSLWLEIIGAVYNVDTGKVDWLITPAG